VSEVALPTERLREKASELHTALNFFEKDALKRGRLEAMLAKAEIVEPTEADWSRCAACRPRGPPSSGTGGYPAALWVLFHTLLANAGSQGPRAAAAVRDWVRFFFGCDECARHFEAYEVKGDAAATAKDASIWLWRAHDDVTARLTREDPMMAPHLRRWPSHDQCPACFGSDGTPDEDAVFLLLQEAYCAGADTFACAAFQGVGSASGKEA